MGHWTASSLTTVESATLLGFQDGDAFTVYGSSTGTEPNATDGTSVCLGTLDTSLGLTFDPIPQEWAAFPFYRLSQWKGTTPAGKLQINGS